MFIHLSKIKLLTYEAYYEGAFEVRRLTDEDYRKMHEKEVRNKLERLIKTKEFKTIGKSTTVCLLELKNGIEVIGKSQLTDYAQFNKDIGEFYAYEDALIELKKIWGLMMILKNEN